MNTGNSDDQNNNRIDCLMNRNPIQNWSVCKFISHSTICEINVQAVFNQFKYIVANAPINKTITSKVFGGVFVRIATCSFGYFYILQCALASTCNNRIFVSYLLLEEIYYNNAIGVFLLCIIAKNTITLFVETLHNTFIFNIKFTIGQLRLAVDGIYAMEKTQTKLNR